MRKLLLAILPATLLAALPCAAQDQLCAHKMGVIIPLLNQAASNAPPKESAAITALRVTLEDAQIRALYLFGPTERFCDEKLIDVLGGQVHTYVERGLIESQDVESDKLRQQILVRLKGAQLEQPNR